MSSGPSDLVIVALATAIADALCGLSWAAFALVAAIALWWSTAARTADLAPEDLWDPGPVKYVFYGLSLVFWPAGLTLAAVFLASPERAVIGRNCAYALLAYVTASVALAMVIVTGAALAFPELFL